MVENVELKSDIFLSNCVGKHSEKGFWVDQSARQKSISCMTFYDPKYVPFIAFQSCTQICKGIIIFWGSTTFMAMNRTEIARQHLILLLALLKYNHDAEINFISFILFFGGELYENCILCLRLKKLKAGGVIECDKTIFECTKRITT